MGERCDELCALSVRLVFGGDDGNDFEAVFTGEIDVALIMCGAAENRAGAVIHQHEIGDVDGERVAVDERVARCKAGVDALLFDFFQRCFGRAGQCCFFEEGGDGGIFGGEFNGERMARRDGAEARAEQSVGPCCEDFERGVCIRCAGEREEDARAFRAPDPVFLHHTDFFGPAVERFKTGEKFVGHVGDFEEPLREFAALNQCAGTPAAPVDDLFVGQHCIVNRIPVYIGFLTGDVTFTQEIKKQFLFVPVILGIAGGEFPLPVNRQPHAFELGAHGGDVFVGPFGGMSVVFDGGVFGRHAESVPAHRVQHVEATGAFEARCDVADGVIADMTHVDLARRVGEHLQHVIFGFALSLGLITGAETTGGFPDILPFGFTGAGIVACRHDLAGSGEF